jgi:cholesterol oxidase
MEFEQNDERATSWLSIELAQLADELCLGGPRALPTSQSELDFDVLIVGSGYGGSIALEELTGHAVDGRPLRIAMLERGREYVPGAFASASAQLAGQVRFATSGASAVNGRPDGLFDARIGSDVNVLVANGLGGGSLINAGVMMPPEVRVLEHPRWPAAIRTDPAWPGLFGEAREKLMATESSAFHTSRTRVMNRLGRSLGPSGKGRARPSVTEPVFITVAAKDDPDLGISACNACGDCATGCNFGAKISVDVSLIARARRRHPHECLKVVTDASVVSFKALSGSVAGWAIDVVHTARDLRRHQEQGYRLFARRLVIAAGTFGSTELLMRARAKGLAVSDTLGAGFSGNGDLIFAIHDLPMSANAVADESEPFAERHVGPTITRMIDGRGDGELNAVIQDLAVPGGLRRVFEECVAMTSVVSGLCTSDPTVHRRDQELADPAGLADEVTDRSIAVAVIADDDGASGHLTLPAATGKLEQGTLGVVWQGLGQAKWQERCQTALERRVRANFPGAKVEANPAWRPLSTELEKLFGRTRGPGVSAHPLGGCAMADSIVDGVVNDCGQVFSDADGNVHDGLVVLDGAIVPMALGINPSLTISTIALRAIRQLRDQAWGFTRMDAPSPGWRPRPHFAVPVPVPRQDTLLEITEKLKTTIRVASPQGARVVNAELELWFKPVGVGTLIGGTAPRVLHVDPSRSRLVLRPPAEPARDCVAISSSEKREVDPKPAPVWVSAPLSGTLALMRHGKSRPVSRRARAIGAWFRNRGLRDIAQSLMDRLQGRPVPIAGSVPALTATLWRMASRAGDLRLMSYDLTVGKPTGEPGSPLVGAFGWEGRSIRAEKHLTYDRFANPSGQLSQARITAFPHWAGGAPDSMLRVDPSHWVEAGVPLLRVVSQRDSPTALSDLASLGLYVARTILPLHCLTLRLPDRPSRSPQRLPADLSASRKFPKLDHVELEVARDSSGGIAHIRLSRYCPDEVKWPNPVMLIHGYSASGTTFVHESLPGGGLVGSLCAAGHDVWVLDLRSSAGMPTAQVEWRFEDMGQRDIPLAMSHILERTGAAKVDVVAHCMGAAMLSLGLLMPVRGASMPDGRSAADAVRPLCKHLGRVVLSQVTPTLVVTPGNSARAYVMQWVRHYARLGHYEFTPTAPTALDDMIDRLLCALPCSQEDFDLENPMYPIGKRTPWVGARHRMDVLYGTTFRLAGLDNAVLARIDDFFGPMHLQTLAQVIAFARSELVTDVQGDGSFVQAANLARYGDSRVLSLHSKLNGLFDFQTRSNALALFRQAGMKGWSVALEGMGHQDSLIGRDAVRVYALIGRFLAGQEIS